MFRVQLSDGHTDCLSVIRTLAWKTDGLSSFELIDMLVEPSHHFLPSHTLAAGVATYTGAFSPDRHVKLRGQPSTQHSALRITVKN